MTKTLKKTIIFITIFTVIFSTYIYFGVYTKIKAEMKSLTFEISLLEAQILKYPSSDIVLNESYDNIDFNTFPVDLREQDQINYFLILNENENVELSQLVMNTATRIGVAGDNTLMFKPMSFSYMASNIEEFEKFFKDTISNEEYPSSITTFTMRVASDGAVIGQMYLNNFYNLNSSSERSYTIDTNISIGNTRLFDYE
ncbi:MAG: hypothetical protein R3Y12_04065 [Clostridia bacterium]